MWADPPVSARVHRSAIAQGDSRPAGLTPAGDLARLLPSAGSAGFPRRRRCQKVRKTREHATTPVIGKGCVVDDRPYIKVATFVGTVGRAVSAGMHSSEPRATIAESHGMGGPWQ